MKERHDKKTKPVETTTRKLPESAADALASALKTLESRMWALVTKLASTPYDSIDDQLADAEKLGKIAGELRILRAARSIAERTRFHPETESDK